MGAQDALNRLLEDDPLAATRQVAVIDHNGHVAVHTGEETMAFAGHITGEAVSCQANIMADERVWPAMIQAFQDTEGRLTERLLAALDAGEAAGGDVRGRQSAAILVVPAQGASWDTVVDLRVEDDDEPLHELHRLVRLHDAYALADEGDELVGQGRHELASEMFQQASALAPDNHELLFWAGLGAAAGRGPGHRSRARAGGDRPAAGLAGAAAAPHPADRSERRGDPPAHLHRLLTRAWQSKITPVKGPGDLRAFVALPYRLHAGTPWVPPLKLERYAFLHRKLNAYFKHAEAQYFLARRDGRVVGRVTAQVDRAYNEYHSAPLGHVRLSRVRGRSGGARRAARRRRGAGCASGPASAWSGRWTSP